ncbi:hypothetical protein [Cellulomonas marina]|uniref:Uncharacterized protein n=1 Tax=Cellulomonas marina TaxID=988821 RepID=A0A1I0W5Y0_9CELL|nr:hypothetical protein [Cellulomonas marina]GIG30001.1 hypothetical protein Cma02nite_26010 [Cellulomonas marina]SFA83700.1 hypothetical protein SAMN05421867_102184 [Cellulomonas marina]
MTTDVTTGATGVAAPLTGARARVAPVLTLGALTGGTAADAALVLTGEVAWAAPGLVVPVVALLLAHVRQQRAQDGTAGRARR